MPWTQGHPSILYWPRCTTSSTSMKIDDFLSSSELNRKKDATTMAHMNMILIGTLKDNINCDILSRNRFLFDCFVLFQLHQSLEWILEFRIFRLFPSVRAYDNETEAKLVCRGQIGWWKDVSVVAANFEAIFRPSGGSNVAISSFVQNHLFC